MKKILISLTEANLEELDKYKKWRERIYGYKESRSAIINKLIKKHIGGL